MKLARFAYAGRTSLGIITEEGVIDLHESEPRLPDTLRAFLAAGETLLAVVHRIAMTSKSRIAADHVRLLAPIQDPQKFLGLGFSYRAHVNELRMQRKDAQIPDNQVWFNKQVSCIVGPTDEIRKPAISEQLDYEGEMAIVIGTRCRHVKARDAQRVIAGFMVCNDVSVRDWQKRAPTATLGKSFDTHGPTGPWLTLVDEVFDAEALRLRTWVNGEIRQDSSTSDFIYSIGEMIEELTTVCTLEPGDILATGTPGGTGATHVPPRYLKVGDSVRIEIEQLGVIENQVVEDSTELLEDKRSSGPHVRN
jgi:2-keto-4-pentenoate hydratase/2-oxohepta-3-ene-1,7-dioic acid hydratase in catechol pathway